MSAVKEDAIEISDLHKNAEVLDSNSHDPLLTKLNIQKSFSEIVTHSETESGQDIESEELSKKSWHISTDVTKNCVQLNKSEENVPVTKVEKRRNVSLTRNEPPPLIHYLQDKETSEVDEDNSPPQLLPEVIVTRTKLHKEKSQPLRDENSFKVFINKNLQKLKRKSWMKYSYNSSLSDDQASSESPEHLSSTDMSHCSTNISTVIRKGISILPEKQRKDKQSCQREKVQKTGASTDNMPGIPRDASSNGDMYSSPSVETGGKSGESILNSSENDRMEDFEKVSLADAKTEIDFESWMTETEEEDDDDDDIFITPQRVSTGKEERDTIDGIEFLGFETERDMVEFTKIEQDFQGCAQNDENITHSDDGLEMMDDSFTYSESEAQTTSQAIIPTKTKDITKIKGWRTKNFAINNNPSDGQCSSSSVGPYEDDDGFVSCDIKTEEDASIDMEEQGDLWSGGEQDLFVYDQLPIENYSFEESNKTQDEIKGNMLLESIAKRKSFDADDIDGAFTGFEDVNIQKNASQEKVENEDSESTSYGTGRYPKRFQTSLYKLDDSINKEILSINQPSDVPKIPKKRGRKPKTATEKKFMLQLINQYKRKRKRGRPKGSVNKLNAQKLPQYRSTEVVYNLRNSSRRTNEMSSSEKLMTISERSKSLKMADKTSIKLEIVQKMTEETLDSLNKTSGKIIKGKLQMKDTDENFAPKICTGSVKSLNKEVKYSSFTLSAGKAAVTNSTTTFTTISPTRTNVTSILTSATLPPSTSPNSFMSSANPNVLSVKRQSSMNLFVSANKHYASPTCLSPVVSTTTASVTTTTVKTVTAASFSDTMTSTPLIQNSSKDRWETKQKHLSDCIVSLVDRSSSMPFEYGLVVTTGIRKPLLPLALEQLKILRQNNNCIDEHWARFSASVVMQNNVTSKAMQSNTVVLPVRAPGLPFMSCTSNANIKPQCTSSTLLTGPRSELPKFAPMTGSSVRMRYPRPATQVGVRTIPSVTKQRKITHYDSDFVGFKKQKKLSLLAENEKDYQNASEIEIPLSAEIKMEGEIGEDIRKIVEDLLSYVQRQEVTDLVVHEDPPPTDSGTSLQIVDENLITKKKKGPMIRELSRLDVNVIEMWDARNEVCNKEYCKLGCICESLECCRPAIEEHCGKEECMFSCQCESKDFKRSDGRQHTLLLPLTLLAIPQQNRRVLAKEEKEFQQTVIRAKHETIVVSSNGSSRRKREIKLPGRYRDSYVALGKEYGLIDFKISSDENIDTSAKRPSKLCAPSTRDSTSNGIQKNNAGASKLSWEMKLAEMKQLYDIKKCFVKMEKVDSALSHIKRDRKEKLFAETSVCEESVENNDFSSAQNPLCSHRESPPNRKILKQERKSRNVATKSTTLPPDSWYNTEHFAARTAPINMKVLRRYKHKSSHGGYHNEQGSSSVFQSISSTSNVITSNLPTSNIIVSTPPSNMVLSSPSLSHVIGLTPMSNIVTSTPTSDIVLSTYPASDITFSTPSTSHMTYPLNSSTNVASFLDSAQQEDVNGYSGSNYIIDDTSGGLGRIECVTSLSVEQFQRGDLALALERLQAENTNVTGNTDVSASTSGERTVRARLGSSLSFEKIAKLLNRRIRELKDIGDNESFPSGSEESIHLLQWRVLKSLFQTQRIQLWYYKCGSKLVITSNKLRPDSTYVNLNDITTQEHNQLPSIIADLFKRSAKKIKRSNRDIFALLHFDGKLVELVGTIYKNRGASDTTNESTEKKIKLLSESKSEVDKEKSYEDKCISEMTSSTSSSICSETNNNSASKNIIDDTSCGLGRIESVTSLVNEQPIINEISSTSAPESCNDNVQPSTSSQCQSGTEDVLSEEMQSTITRYDNNYVTRVRKLKTVLQSTRVHTASGERVSVPLPSCAVDSRWYVLNLLKRFDILYISSRKCFVKQIHIVESIRMASSHGKTVRLTIQDPNSASEDQNQPKFGIYAVPHVALFVFIGPYELNEEPTLSLFASYNRTYVNVNEASTDGHGDPEESLEEHSGQENVTDILKKLCHSSVSNEGSDPWLFTRRTSENESRDAFSHKHEDDFQNNSAITKSNTDTVSQNSRNSEETLKVRAVCTQQGDTNNVDVKHVKNSGQTSYRNIEENLPRKETDEGCVPSFSKENMINNSPVKICPSPSGSKRKSEEFPGKSEKKCIRDNNKAFVPSTHSSSLQITPTPPSSSKKTLLASETQTSKKPVPNIVSPKSLQLSPLTGWLVPSYSWVGCIPCNYDKMGGLYFAHPVSGVKMMFSNLESTQLWLDRLFQSAILYIPRQLFITWNLKTDLETGLQPFDSNILNGNYIMTAKGIFDIDKLIATEAEKYALKPIEVLRLQDKKCRRDLELGLFQVQRALRENGHADFPTKHKIIEKAIEDITTAKKESKELEKERRRWKNVKHKSLLKLYNMMKGLPIDEKRAIVQKLKTQCDKTEDISAPSKEQKDPNDGMTFSMARYCGNVSIFTWADESDLEEYLSEYEEETEDSAEDSAGDISKKIPPCPPSAPDVKKEKENPVKARNNVIDLVSQEDDESVSISVVSPSSKDEPEIQTVDNTDDITVTCLSESVNSRNPIYTQLLKQNSVVPVKEKAILTKQREKIDNSAPNILKTTHISVKPISALTSPSKTTQDPKNSVSHTVTLKRKLSELNCKSSLEESSKKKQTKSVTFPTSDTAQAKSVTIPTGGDTSLVNSGFDSVILKKYKTIKIDSKTKLESSDFKSINTSLKSSTEGFVNDSNGHMKNTTASTSSSTKCNSSTLYFNVVAQNPKNNTPLYQEEPIHGCVPGFSPERIAVRMPTSSSSISNSSVKFIRKEMKQVFVKRPRGAVPVLLTNTGMPPTTIVQTSCGVLGSVAIDPKLPMLKKVPRESVPPGVEPCPASILPPPLVPIMNKKQTKPLSEHTAQLLTSIAPLPTLIKMIDGLPVDKGS